LISRKVVMCKMKIFFIFVVIVACSLQGIKSSAATLTSNGTGGGLWDDASSWDDILIPEDYFGDLVNGSIPDRRITAHWISLAGGIRVELFRNFFMGWTVLANIKLSVGDAGNMAPYNIPGFGPGENRAGLVIKYSLEYRIPTQRYHPLKIVKRRSEP